MSQSVLICHMGALKLFPMTLRRIEPLHSKTFFSSLMMVGLMW